MTLVQRPFRSVLYVPASNARAVEKTKTLPVDALIFDLEDAVAVSAKTNARRALAEAIAADGFGKRTVLVRVNGMGTKWCPGDITMLGGLDIDGLVVPKVNGAADIQAVSEMSADEPLWAMIETPSGVLHAPEIAAHPRVAGLVMGTNDLAAEIRCGVDNGRSALTTSLQMCLLAARAHGVICLDGVFNAFRDEAGLRAECEQAKELGFDGKTLIHPGQIVVANDVFSPTRAEIVYARRVIEAVAAAEQSGQGVAVLDGRIVENLHKVGAKAILAKADAIAEMEA